jgi:xylulokinase
MSVLLSAASAFEWAAGVLGERDLLGLEGRARACGLARGTPLFLPYLSGERTPHNDPHGRGVFFGMTPQTSQSELAVAVLEGVALAFADGLDVLLEAGSRIDEISVTGGGARFAYWGQLLAAALNRPLTYRQGGEVSAAVGAARLGRLALTREAPEQVCHPPPVARVVEPDAALTALLTDRRRIFRRLYRDLKESFTEFSS